MGLFRKKSKPKEGAIKTVNGIHYAYRGGKWVRMSDKAQAQINKNDALNRANVGGTTKLLKGQKDPSNRSSVSVKTDGKNGKNDKKEFKKGPVVKSVGTVDFNINKDHSGTSAGLTAYNKAKKASIGLKTDKERDKATTKVLYGNRNKLSSKNNKGGKKGNNFETTVHTRHYKTGERLGVMTGNQRRNYEKAARGQDGKLRTFEGEVSKHEKSSGHGKSHLRETKYKASLRKGGNKNSSSNKNRETLKTTQGKSMQSNPPGMRQKGVGKTANDLTRHLKKKKKKDEIKYPTYGTFRGL